MTAAGQPSHGPGHGPGYSPGLGFDDYTLDSQAVFRAVLDATARPGRISTVRARPETPAPLDVATTAVALCLFDHDTRIWLGDGIAGVAVYEYLRFHCGCPIVKSGLAADFAVVLAAAGVPGLSQFDTGSDAFPDRSATLVIQVPDLEGGAPVRLTGPGIETEEILKIAGVPDYFWNERLTQQEMFPRGIDLVFACGDRLVALPRSTEIEV
ncbi:MAG: phosphonate C-P lyase system protein PhnH [Rhodospirillaceae bacterium]